MRVVTEKLVFDVEETAKGAFLLTPISCTCEDQSKPNIFPCDEEPNVYHGCNHPSAGKLELEEFDVKLGRQIHFNCRMVFGIPIEVKLGKDESCCDANTNRVLEIIP